MSDLSDPSRTLQSLAEELSDQALVNWREALEREPLLASTIEGLQIIERVAMAHRSARAQSAPSPEGEMPEAVDPLFCWGPLQVLDRIGEGNFAEVYRAFDPSLRRYVALKLRRSEEATSASSRWIEEARRMAGVRHPNVLITHGAAVHDDREGIWTELIEGITLTEWVRREGPLGAREAANLGMDVCRAVAAVHASGLVHGDVKASNVMRESGGRIVLMDFGSGHRQDEPAGGGRSATPLVSAPEVLRGERSTTASDVYALGVLLYWLVSGEYPVEAESIGELRRHMEAGEFVALRARRPDLPRAFIAIVDRALAADSTLRWKGPAELEAALAGLLALSLAPTDAGPPSRRASIWVMTALVLAAIGALYVPWSNRVPNQGPSQGTSPFERIMVAGSGLSVDVSMVQVVNGELQLLAPGSPLASGMQLALELDCSQPTHVYVLNEDANGELFVLFPVEGVDLGNPLAGGRRHVLPGRKDGRQQSWVVTSAGGTERFLTVVSREPLPALEVAIADFRRASADRTHEVSGIGGHLRESLRGVGGMAAVEERAPGTSDILENIASSLAGSTTDPDGLWVWSVSFPNPAGEAIRQ